MSGSGEEGTGEVADASAAVIVVPSHGNDQTTGAS